MKVLFLDVDGVLNCTRDFAVIHPGNSPVRLNRDMLDRLHAIVKETACEIVLSSTWRKDDDSFDFLTMNGIRGLEIQSWLDAHPEVTQYCILDDDSDMLEKQLSRFVQTTNEHGLTATHAYRVKYILNHGVRGCNTLQFGTHTDAAR